MQTFIHYIRSIFIICFSIISVLFSCIIPVLLLHSSFYTYFQYLCFRFYPLLVEWSFVYLNFFLMFFLSNKYSVPFLGLFADYFSLVWEFHLFFYSCPFSLFLFYFVPSVSLNVFYFNYWTHLRFYFFLNVSVEISWIILKLLYCSLGFASSFFNFCSFNLSFLRTRKWSPLHSALKGVLECWATSLKFCYWLSYCLVCSLYLCLRFSVHKFFILYLT